MSAFLRGSLHASYAYLLGTGNGQIDVTNVEYKTILSLLEEIERLESELTRGTGDMETARDSKKWIDELQATIMGGGLGFDPGRWSQLREDQRKHLLDRLTMARDDLLVKKVAGPVRHSSYLLEGEEGSKHLILWLTVFGFIFAATLLSLIR